MKTANHYFPSGILSFDAEPLFTGDMLTYNGKYYLIGEGHKEFIAEKVNDEDYYILTLAAAEGCTLEFTQRDVYTVNNDIGKVRRYVGIIKEESENFR